MVATRTIYLHVDAPPKPALGSACNGCGVCCASEPCPVGVLVSRRRRGACAALRWREAEQHYRCGLLLDPKRVATRPLRSIVDTLWRRWVHRVIATGIGCDADVETQPFRP